MAEARIWRVHPDPDTGEVDLDSLHGSLMEVAVLLRRGGGAVQIIAHRRRVATDDPRENPAERFTESVDIQWLARTDTRPQIEDVPAAEHDPEAEVAEGAELEREPAAVG